MMVDNKKTNKQQRFHVSIDWTSIFFLLLLWVPLIDAFECPESTAVMNGVCVGCEEACEANEIIINHRCRKCSSTTRRLGKENSCRGAESCGSDRQYIVVDHLCQACGQGQHAIANTCLCPANQIIVNQTCQSCAWNQHREKNRCEPLRCNKRSEIVTNHTCNACMWNEHAVNNSCELLICPENAIIENHACRPCGQIRHAVNNTICSCPANQQFVNGTCEQCSRIQYRNANDPNQCIKRHCGANEIVRVHNCEKCGPGRQPADNYTCADVGSDSSGPPLWAFVLIVIILVCVGTPLIFGGMFYCCKKENTAATAALLKQEEQPPAHIEE